MIQWFKNLFTKPEPQKEPIKPKERIKVTDYPVGQYSVYWEVITTPVFGGLQNEVRFNGYRGIAVREVFHITGPDQSYLDEKTDAFIEEHMQQYKRV